MMARRSRDRRPSNRVSRHGGYNKVRARTERMHASVRLAFCFLVLAGCVAFLVAALQPYRELGKVKADLAEVQQQESLVIGDKDAKERELRAIEEDPAYLELIARDVWNYYKSGEHVFRVER